MTPFPFSFGPSDDWDPQGYNKDNDEELEDELMTAGMSIKTDDVDDEDVPVVAVEEEAAGEDAEDKEEEVEAFEDIALDPLAALDDLADQVNRTERETLRFKTDFDE
ncbi:MAG: hypothetical protein PHC53_00615 [Patescibacteria group bacterium]|nr:hypothetical protein [Patescibacteria group bacterium]